LRPLGYLRDDPAKTYRTLQWLQRAGLVEPEWETAGPGPARTVFTITNLGRATVERCADSIRERTAHLQRCLSVLPATVLPATTPFAVGKDPHRFEVLVEAKLSVSADDQSRHDAGSKRPWASPAWSARACGRRLRCGSTRPARSTKGTA